jgi:hypothetical protein
VRGPSRFDGDLIDQLLAAGHDVEMLGEGCSDLMGHAGAVVLHPTDRSKAGMIRVPTAAPREYEICVADFAGNSVPPFRRSP